MKVIGFSALVAFIATSCSLFPWQSSRYGGSSSEVFFLDIGKESARELTYTIRLGENVADVYFAFVNYGSDASTRPTVDYLTADLSASQGQVAETPEAQVSGTTTAGLNTSLGSDSRARSVRTRLEPPEISRFNNDPPSFDGVAGPFARAGTGAGATSVAEQSSAVAASAVGDSQVFWQYSGNFQYSSAVQVDARLRAIAEDDDGNILNVWVADEEWSTAATNSTDMVTQDKVNALADAFLMSGEDNDIHDWVTAMIGAPWGSHSYDALLSAADYGGTIDILLLDILRDGATDAGVVGFFWGKDNYYQTDGTGQSTDHSNERIMFYLDAPMYGQREDGEWSVTNWWPQLVFSTLAHEFQHMIHFYQKSVLRNTGEDPETWLNEMASLVTEDLVSYQMGVPGPRGVDPADYPAGDAGASGNQEGWLGEFNANNDISLYAWDYDDPSPDYAMSYAFGAFMARNFGGANFLREVVQSTAVDETAIDLALDNLGYRTSLREALSLWAAAVLVSDEEIVPWIDGEMESVYNPGEWFESTTNGTTYRLGAINLYNHAYAAGSTIVEGPTVYSGDSIGSDDSRPPASIVYFKAGDSLTGTHEWEIAVGPHTDLVVVAKAVN